MVRIPATCACILGACVQPAPLTVESASGEIARLEAWSATLVSSGDSTELRGTAIVALGRTIAETQAHVRVTGAVPNAVHPWYLQLGDCGNDRGVLGFSTMACPSVSWQ
jgi:hypothetical protein